MEVPPSKTRRGEAFSARTSLIIPGDRPADAVAFEGEVVDFFFSAASILGVPKSVAAIYGVIFASSKPLSFAEIDARLNISTGSISQGLRVLREVGALRESAAAAGTRVTRYEPDLEMRRLVGRFIETRLEAQLTTGKSRLASLREAVPAGSDGDVAVLRSRLQSLQDWHSKASALLPLARTFLKLGA